MKRTIYFVILIALIGISCKKQDNNNQMKQSDLMTYWNSLRNAVNHDNYTLLNQLIYNPVGIYNYKSQRVANYDNSYIYSIMDALNTSAKDFINTYTPKLQAPEKIQKDKYNFIMAPDTTAEYYIYKFQYNQKDNYLMFRMVNSSLRLQYAKLEFGEGKEIEEIEYEKQLRFLSYYEIFKKAFSSGMREEVANIILFEDFYINGKKMDRYLFHTNYSNDYPVVPKNQSGNSLQQFMTVTKQDIKIAKNGGSSGVSLPQFAKGTRIIYITLPVENTKKIRRYYFKRYDEKYFMVGTELI